MDKQHFALNRRHDRVETDIPCRLGLPGGRQHDATILNLSVGGLKLACNRSTYVAIIPEDQHTPGQISDVRANIRFTLRPVNRKAMALNLTAMVVHSERLAQDTYHIGLHFVEIGKTDSNRLESYIGEALSARNSG
ncbi:MAG: PilZ domain-containing protein [Thiohalobacterales bacterium]|nr:PilZ domain-containing protein [Thiohalobacterales bacterium]